jgi:hypothetical protein
MVISPGNYKISAADPIALRQSPAFSTPAMAPSLGTSNMAA